MKIYCSRNDKLSFDYYIGKDIWVAVGSKNNSASWIRFIDKTDKSYIFNAVFVDDIYTGGNPQIFESLGFEWHLDLEDANLFYVVQPIETRTTQEIIDMLETSIP